jgi:hypothetical protein
MAWLTRSFLSIDPRTLGAARILLGLLLLLDLGKRVPGIPFWYTNDGLLPNHRLLFRPAREWTLSLLYGFTTVGEIAVAFGLMALVYLAFLAGWKTRVMHVLSWLCLLSLQTRIDLLATGADFVFGTLVTWTLFLPMGARYSLDAALARRRAPHEAGRRPEPERPIVSLAVLALIVQLAVIYLFNALHKNGPTWRDGTAIYWVLHQARIVTHFGLWVREHAPLSVLQAFSYATVAIEFVLPFLIVSPWGRPWTRRAAIALIFGLHTGAQLVMNLGMFTPAMIVFSALLVSSQDWEALARLRERARGGLRALLDAPARVALRVDERLEALYGTAVAAPPVTPLRARLRRRIAIAREATVALLIAAATSQVLVENRALARLRVRQPRALHAIVSYLRLQQGWSMFAPDAPTTDQSLVVDARTADGRHVDPYNEVASDIADPALRAVPARLGHDASWCDYTVRILDHKHLHDRLALFIRDYHVRTGRPEDRVVSFTAYVVEQDSPRPGETGARNVRARRFLGYQDRSR